MQYFYFITTIFILSLVENNSRNSFVNKDRVIIYYWFVLFVALAVGLRGNEDEYTRVYLIMPTLADFFLGGHEIVNEKGWLFSFVASFFKTLTFSSQSIFLFFSGISVFIHAFYFRKFTSHYFLAFLLYLCHEIAFKEWVGLRMGAASALVLPMIYYLHKRDNFKFFMLVISASMIQYVAVLSALLYFINRRFKPIFLWAGLIISVILLKTHFVYNTLWQLDSLGVLPSLVSSYLGYATYVYDAGLGHVKTVQQIITLSAFIYLFGYKKSTSSLYNLLFNTYYLSTILYILFAEVALFAFRFGGHFYSVEPILLVYLIYSVKQKIFAANIIAISALIIAYINYVVIERVEPYDLFVNYPTPL
jgi:hypothetical protein